MEATKVLAYNFFLKKGFDLDKDFAHNFQDAKVFRISIKSHKDAVK